LSPNSGPGLLPVEPSRQLSSSPNPSSSKRSCINAEQLECQHGRLGLSRKNATKMRSAGSSKTAAPIGTSASKRKAKQAQVAKLVQDSASRVRKLSSPTFAQSADPEQNNDFMQASPQFFPSLDFSPDVFGFPSAGPATAPVYPQQRLFWDPDTSMGPMDMDFSGGGLDMFESNLPFDFNDYVSTEAAPRPVPAMTTSCMGSDGQNPTAQTNASRLFATKTSIPEMTAGASSTARPSTKKLAVKPMTVDHAVNPNLLFSNPGHQDLSHGLGTSITNNARDIRQPYLHQMQESRREKEVERSRRAKARRTSHKSSSQAAEPGQEKRPRLDRRSTDTALGKGSSNTRKHNQGSSYHRPKVEKEWDTGHLQRKLSPIKSQPPERSSTTVGHPRLRPQTSVTFTIDDNGRARTETRLTRDEAESETDQDIDRRGWGNSDSESSEDADAEIATSFYSSFTFPSTKPPKLARFSTDSISHSKKSSYSSTYTSSRSEHTVSDRGPASQIRHRSSLGSRGHPHSSGTQKTHGAGPLSSGIMSDYGPAPAGDLPSEAETVVDSDQPKGDAQHALKKLLKDRARKPRTEKSSLSNSKTREKSRRQAPPPTKYQAHSSSAHQPAAITTPTNLQPYKVLDPAYNLSPTPITDPDLTSPSTDRGSSASDSTRCVCHTSESGGHLMIQW